MRRTPGIVWALVLLSAAGLVVLFAGGGPASDEGVRSYEPEGRVALLAVLGELGFRAEPWADAPAELPRGGALLWLDRAPPRPPGYGSGSEGRPRPRVGPRRTRDVRHYARFVEEGGALVVPRTEDTDAFLREVLGLPAVGALRLAEDAADRAQVALAGGEHLELTGRRPFRAPPPRNPWRPFVTAEDGSADVLHAPLGRGTVVLLADDAFCENARVGEADHALLAVRIAEAFAPGRRVLFDEYALGGWDPPSPLELAFDGRTAPLALHAVLLGALGLAALLGRRDFPRDPEPLRRLSPLTRARGAAALLERAGRYPSLGGLLRLGAAERLARRARARQLVGEEGLAGWTSREVAALRRGLSLPEEPEAARRWERALLGPPPANRAELAALDAELAGVEAEGASRWNGPGAEHT